VARTRWERWAALGGFAFVAFYVGAFGLGIEVGDSNSDILDYYRSSGHRDREIVAFFFIAAAALGLVLLASGLRSLVTRTEELPRTLAALTWAGGTACATLVLAGDAVSRTPAFASMDDKFRLDPNVARIFNDAGFLLYVTAALVGIVLVASVSLAILRFGILPRWLAWAGFVAAVLLPLAIAFVGYLVFALWVLVVSVALVRPGAPAVT
jgi:hypothetical protein